MTDFRVLKGRIETYGDYIKCKCHSLKVCCFQTILNDGSKEYCYNCQLRFREGGKKDDEYRSCYLYSRIASLK